MKTQRIRVGGKYILDKQLGKGSFGVVYQAKDTVTSMDVAVKLETVRAKGQQLGNEANVLRGLQGCPGFPELYWHGTEGGYNILVAELLGSSLENLKATLASFSMKTTVQCTLQLLQRLKDMHDRCYIHRDMKPDNILLGKTNPALIYLIDFGLSRKFTDPKSKQHIPFKENKPLIGTARYASVNNHAGVEQSRRDDLESLAYILLYLLKGKLPWQGIKAKNKRLRYGLIGEFKRSESTRKICKDVPEEFAGLLDYARSLKFEEAPNYEFLISMFTDFAHRIEVCEGEFDWIVKPTPRESRRISAELYGPYSPTRKRSQQLATGNDSSSPSNRRRSYRQLTGFSSNSPSHRSKVEKPSKLRCSTMSPCKLRRIESIETIEVPMPHFKDRKVLMARVAKLEPSCLLDDAVGLATKPPQMISFLTMTSPTSCTIRRRASNSPTQNAPIDFSGLKDTEPVYAYGTPFLH